jgi:hypothetical protein
MMRELKYFLELRGLITMPLGEENNALSSIRDNGIAFYIRNSDRNGYTFSWQAELDNEESFSEKSAQVKKAFPKLNPELKVKKKCRLFIDVVDQKNYKACILNIIKKTKDIMGYMPRLKLTNNEDGKEDTAMTYIESKIALLKKSKNLILTGAPGTGKTFLARQMAVKMIAGKIEEKNLSDVEREKFKKQYCFVQFHPSYDYTDFVEGLRPAKPDEKGNIGFELKNGIFKHFCNDALAAWEEDEKKRVTAEKRRKFVFVIDEINRGEISKIFGELFFSIDPGYRGISGKVQTQYANLQSDKTIFDTSEGQGWFYVPENVYIIGTMNDIDRSVESFDFAMRRRFVWEEVTAEESAGNMKLSDGAKKRMTALNDAIWPAKEEGGDGKDKKGIEGLGSAYHIGAAYFLVKDENDKTFDELWEFRLKPLLSEYVRGTPDADKSMEKLENAYKR